MLVQGFLMIDFIPDVLFPGLRIDNLVNVLYQSGKIKILLGQIHFPVLYLGHIQYVIDQGQQVPGRGINLPETVLHALNVPCL